MTRFLCLLVALPLLAAAPEQQIRQVLDDQVSAWNRGDIPAFMDGYDKSESTTFVSATVTKGHAQVLAGYLQRYPTREKMGTLRFSDLEIKMLGSDYASVLGRFHLDRSAEAGGEAAGIFTPSALGLADGPDRDAKSSWDCGPRARPSSWSTNSWL